MVPKHLIGSKIGNKYYKIRVVNVQGLNLPILQNLHFSQMATIVAISG